MSETQGSYILADAIKSAAETLKSGGWHPMEVRVSSEINERAKTKDRPEKDYGTATKVEVTFSIEDLHVADDETVREYVASLHAQLEEACQGEIRRRSIAGRDDE